jgi:hypothetical protein
MTTQASVGMAEWITGREPSRFTAPRVRRARVQIPGQVGQPIAFHSSGVDKLVPTSAGVEVLSATGTKDG